MLFESIKYMIVGMGIVFLFLGFMVLVLNWQRVLVEKILAKQKPHSTNDGKDASAHPSFSNLEEDKETIAAISAAVHTFRKKHS